MTCVKVGQRYQNLNYSRTKLTTGMHTLLLNLAKYDAKIKDRIHLAKVGQIPQKMLNSAKHQFFNKKK